MKNDAAPELLENLRVRIVVSGVRTAFDTLVQYGVHSGVYTAGPGSHGYIKDFRFEAGGEQPFAFTCNKEHLLFYLRPAGVRRLGTNLKLIQGRFPDLKLLRKSKEWSVLVRVNADAQWLIENVLEPWSHDTVSGGIPEGITEEDIEAAARAIDAGSAGAQFGESKNWDVVVNGRLYPPKRLLGVAGRRAAGRDLTPYDFQGGEESKCHRILAGLGFEIVRKGDLQTARDVTEEGVAREIRQRADIGPTEKQALIQARRGQGVYRANLEQIEQSCRVTRVMDRRHLRASHIKPWRDCSDVERLDGHNGLLLSPHVDHLFDQGYISFSDDGKLLVSKQLNGTVLKRWTIDEDLRAGSFSPRQKAYLHWHRTHIFDQPEPGRRKGSK